MSDWAVIWQSATSHSVMRTACSAALESIGYGTANAGHLLLLHAKDIGKDAADSHGWRISHGCDRPHADVSAVTQCQGGMASRGGAHSGNSKIQGPAGAAECVTDTHDVHQMLLAGMEICSSARFSSRPMKSSTAWSKTYPLMGLMYAPLSTDSDI